MIGPEDVEVPMELIEAGISKGLYDEQLFLEEDPETWDHCDTCGVLIRRTALAGCDGWLHDPEVWATLSERNRKALEVNPHPAVPHADFCGDFCADVDQENHPWRGRTPENA